MQLDAAIERNAGVAGIAARAPIIAAGRGEGQAR
jgi:hypothetical protein